MYLRLTFALLLFISFSANAAPTPLRTDYDNLFKNLLVTPKSSPLIKAFAAMVLNRDLPQANADLESAWTGALGEFPAITPEVADSQFKWQFRTWVRLYYLFGPTGSAAPNRLSEANAQRIESLFWNYAADKSRVARADLKYVWFIQGSENHDLMDLGNAFLATQALAHLPAYKDRDLPDGQRPAAHAAMWTAYFTRYMEERFRNGLNIEFASPIYGKYFIPELANILDFAEDHRLQENTRALLDLIWADWAVEQLQGVRGGAKARCYQGKYARKGTNDCWFSMGNLLLHQGDWASPGTYAHPIMGFGPILATSSYRLPPMVAALATEPEKRGDYAYVSRRPGRMTHVDPLPPYDNQSCWYNFADEDSRMLRYSWCTPHHILGSYSLDPALREDYQIYPGEPDRAAKHYAAISTQNLWQGVIFDTNPDARIVPQCVAKPDKNKPEFSTTYVQQLAVQHENILLLQANRAHPDIHAMGLYFGPGMKDRLVEEKGWLLLEEGASYAAIRVFDHATIDRKGTSTWKDENVLMTEDPWTPIALVTGQKSSHATLADFANYLETLNWTLEHGKLTGHFTDQSNKETTLSLFTEEARLPEKNGHPVNLSPATYYDNPFFEVSDEGRAVTLRFLEQMHRIALSDSSDVQ